MIIKENVLFGAHIECEDCSRMVEILEQETECDGCGHIIWCCDLTASPRCDPYNTTMPRDTKRIESEIDANRALVDAARAKVTRKIIEDVITRVRIIAKSHTRKT